MVRSSASQAPLARVPLQLAQSTSTSRKWTAQLRVINTPSAGSPAWCVCPSRSVLCRIATAELAGLRPPAIFVLAAEESDQSVIPTDLSDSAPAKDAKPSPRGLA